MMIKILIVEDDPGLCELMREEISDCGYTVDLARSAQQALESFEKSGVPDLLLLDYSLPDMNAAELVKHILAKYGQVPPFIVSTGMGDESVAVEMMKLGARDYLVKDSLLISRLAGVVQRVVREIEKDNKLKAAEKAMKAADQKLLEERTRLANIIKAANVGTWEWNLLTGKVVFNSRWAEILGMTLDELGHLNIDVWKQHVHPMDYQESNRLIKELIEGTSEYYVLEVRMRHKSGDWVWVLTRGGITEFSSDGKPLKLSGTHQDITDKKQKEALQKEIELARQSVKFKQNFLANMSHEIRTPLTGVMGMIEVLYKSAYDSKQKDYINTLKTSAENLREIIDQVLDFSKIEAGKLNLKVKSFCLDVLLDNVHKLYEHNCSEDVKLLLENKTGITSCLLGDEVRLGQVLNNLVSNALKFTQKGYVKVTAHLESTTNESGETLIKITVEDTGSGIRPEKQARLFTPFMQIEENDIRSHDGAGLGLVISKELVKLHGGELGFESVPDKGSAFWFTFPVYYDKSDVVCKENANGGSPASFKLNVLYVEDKIVNQKVVKLMLESLGHHVVLASNGKEALGVFEPGTFDLVLMDIQMPVMDGIAATAELRRKFTQLPPIVGLSANAFEGDREKYMQQGLDEYITKPIKTDDFVRLAGKLFDRKKNNIN